MAGDLQTLIVGKGAFFISVQICESEEALDVLKAEFAEMP